jgi:hypothetical protein
LFSLASVPVSKGRGEIDMEGGNEGRGGSSGVKEGDSTFLLVSGATLIFGWNSCCTNIADDSVERTGGREGNLGGGLNVSKKKSLIMKID